jgi:hypothetical protein
MRGTHRVIRQLDFPTIFLGIHEHSRCISRERGFKELPQRLGITQRAYLAKSFRLSASRFAGLMMTMSKLIAGPVPAQVIEISCDAMMLCERESR